MFYAEIAVTRLECPQARLKALCWSEGTWMVSMAAEPHAMPPSGHARRPLLMSMTEIAELARVQRPVVTTWRRRYRDFPAPGGGDAMSPLFDSRQVADWLIATGRDREGRIETDLSLHALAGLGAGMAPRDLVAVITTLICLRATDDEPLAAASGDVRDELMRQAARLDPHDTCLLSETSLLPADAGWLAGAVDELVEAAWGCQEAFERIMSAGQRFKVGDLYARTSAPRLWRLAAELSSAPERARQGTISVCDPAAGPGDLLVAVADVIGPDYQAIYQVADADSYLARLTGRRMFVHGVAWTDLQMAIGREPSEEWDDPDVIVTQIGYVPGESRSPEEVMDRLDDISLRLAPGCTAVVIGPADVLAGQLRPYSQAERTRAKVLSSGIVESIVRLPGGLAPFRPGYEVALWVLTSAYNSPWRGWVLLADVSDRELTDEVIEALVEDVVTWRRDGYRPYAHTRAFGVQVRISDLVEALRPLSARSPAAVFSDRTEGPELVNQVYELEAGLDRLAADSPVMRQPIRSQLAARARTSPPTQTIGALAKAKRLTILPGTRLRGTQIGGDGHHVVIGVPELLGRARRGDRRLDRVTLAGLRRAHLTEHGDVIVTTTPEFKVMVDPLRAGSRRVPRQGAADPRHRTPVVHPPDPRGVAGRSAAQPAPAGRGPFPAAARVRGSGALTLPRSPSWISSSPRSIPARKRRNRNST